jgi:hypothetical protein
MFKFYSSRQAIMDMISIKEQISTYCSDKPKYKLFLDYIFIKDYESEDNLKYPTLKEISKATGMKYSLLSKLIKELYTSLFEYESDISFKFNNVEVIYFMNYFDNRAQVTMRDLKFLPQVGDQVDMGFVHAQVGTTMFYVDSIEHEFSGNTQRVFVTLRSGYYNSYLQQKRHRAFEEGEITSSLYYSGSDYDLRRELKIGGYR